MESSRTHHVSSAQIRAARSLLNWSQDDLANATSLSIATIRRIELGTISPRNATADEIRRAFEDAGLEFIEPGGVRQRPEDIMIYQGIEGTIAFFDDVYETVRKKPNMRKGPTEIAVVSPSEDNYFTKILGDYRDTHIARMIALKNTVTVRCILTEDKTELPATGYCEYRWLSKHYLDSVPFYIYDDKYAIMISESNPSPKIVVFQSRTVADAFRHQFYSMWDKAEPLNKVTAKF